VNASVAKATPPPLGDLQAPRLDEGAQSPLVNDGTQPLEAESRATDSPRPVIRRLGLVEYEPTWREMQRFTNERDASTRDEIWFLEHPPVYTLGMNASPAHCSRPVISPLCRLTAVDRLRTTALASWWSIR